MPASDDRIVGLRPVAEAMAAGVAIHRLSVATGHHPQLDALVTTAETAGIEVRRVERERLDRLAGGLRHQGVVADAEPYRYRQLQELVEIARGAAGTSASGPARPIVLADGVSDPQNVGAMLRVIDAAGAAGLVVGEHRAAGVTPAARKASAGAADHVAVARVTNVGRAASRLMQDGFWLVGLDSEGETDLYAADIATPIAVVVGSEGKGLSRLMRERCDMLARIAMSGRVASLNVAQSLAVALFEWRRRAESASGKPVDGSG